jgi:O-antigen biosynthesis protein WbqP
MSVVSQERKKRLRRVDVSKTKYSKIKRILDILGALLALMLLALPLGILALVVYFDDPGAVIFAQDRVGMYGRQFRLYKLRTMKQNAPAYLSTDEMENPGRYVTKAGRILRKLSLDEIPQLFNVLKGDMSLVGPRPLIPQEKEIHDLRTAYGVYTTRPGITGLAQINGRDQVTAEDKVRMDVTYLRRFSFMADLAILIMTIPKVIDSEGVRLDDWEPEKGEPQ